MPVLKFWLVDGIHDFVLVNWNIVKQLLCWRMTRRKDWNFLISLGILNYPIVYSDRVQKFQVSSKGLRPEMCGTPTRWCKDSITHQDLATCAGWHCSTSLILINFWVGKEHAYIEQRSKQTACVSLNFSHVLLCQQELRAGVSCLLLKGKATETSTTCEKKLSVFIKLQLEENVESFSPLMKKAKPLKITSGVGTQLFFRMSGCTWCQIGQEC